MRILVVEDNERLATNICTGLKEAGYAADKALDGESALALLDAYPYDALVLDVMLPGVDGVEVTRRLRRQGSGLPILMLTARDAVVDRVSGLDSGADDYVVKPFAFQELLARLRTIMRRPLPGRSARLEAGDLVLDTAARSAEARGRRLELTAKEFTILEYLIVNQRIVVSREQILDHAWDASLEGGANLVEVYIGRIRKKLRDAGAGDRLTTVRGSGYRFE